MNILVTGGAGFIGSHTALELAKNGFTPIIVDNFSNSKREIVGVLDELMGQSLKVYDLDVTDKMALRNVFSENSIDAVIHFAAFKYVVESVVDPLKYFSNNVIGGIALLEVMDEYNVDKLIFSSSCTAYGASATAENMPLSETLPIGNTTNSYGASKFIQEVIIQDVCKATGLKCLSLRYFNAVGADKSGKIGDNPPRTFMLFPAIVKVLKGVDNSLEVRGHGVDTPDGTCLRDYIHASDPH
ncbi:MAG: SDR family NAD(P)-dependent oxidoreductase [Candidatus Ancillula sp.]|jgi:UDP-glucose 4-epimerase|nr:SDR family NAD(P)-dependent oxidoreductase [Candidatus Ancillula sp.]